VTIDTPFRDHRYAVSLMSVRRFVFPVHNHLFLRSLLTLFTWLSKKCWKALLQILQGDVSNKAILSIGSCRFVNWLKPFYRLAYATLFSVSGNSKKKRFADTPYRGLRSAVSLMSVRRIAKIGCFHSFE
jgi:hypothetical protein